MATLQLIRNATLKIEFGNITLLVDPMLGKKGSFESYGTLASNPISDLPIAVSEVLKDVDAVLVSHLHKDHFDDAARTLMDKELPVFCQPADQDRILKSGFRNVSQISDCVEFHGLKIYRTKGNHGRGPIEAHMGNVSGFILEHPNEPTLYLVGDCIFNEKVKFAIDQNHPNYIVTNSGGAFIPGFEENLILMEEEETMAIANYATNATIIAVHLEALDHCTVNRASLKRTILLNGLDNRILLPLDGEKIELT